MTPRRTFRRRVLLPSTVRNVRERRELVLSIGLVAGLQLAIAVTLAVSAVQTYHMWRQHVPYIPRDVARAVPAFFSMGAVVSFLVALRSLGRVRTLQRTPVDPGPEEETDPR
jgi:hypothetical protein